MLKTLFRTKDLDEILASAADPHTSLKRVLGAWQVTLLGIGAIIGAGIFTTVGTATAGDAQRPGAGPSLMLSFVITAVVCAFTALCYAEFSSRVPISGSAYTYSYATLGELVAWIIGWDLIIEYAVGNVAVAISWSGYFRNLMGKIGIDIPPWLVTDYRTGAKIEGLFDSAPHVFGVPIVFNLVAFLIIMAITAILIRGVQESSRFNAAMVLIKLLVLMFFVGIALSLVSPAKMAVNYHPFFPNGFAGTLHAAAVVFFAYIGFDAVSTVAEETKNPRRDLPIGILASLGICTLIYVVVSAIFIGLVPFQKMVSATAAQRAEPLTMALDYVAPNSPFASTIVALGSVVALSAVLLVFQMGQPRIFFSMARDGLLPQGFAKVHPRFKTPHVTTFVTGLVVATIAGFANIDEMVDLTNIGTLFAFVLVCIGVPLLRRQEARKPESAASQGAFRVPGGPYLLPLMGAVSCVGLMVYLPPASWWRFVGWLLMGLGAYSSYGFAHSTVGRKLGRPTTTPSSLRLAAIGFLLAGLGLILIPHELPLGQIFASLAAPGDAPRAALGSWLAVLGVATGLAGWFPVLRRPATS